MFLGFNLDKAMFGDVNFLHLSRNLSIDKPDSHWSLRISSLENECIFNKKEGSFLNLLCYHSFWYFLPSRPSIRIVYLPNLGVCNLGMIYYTVVLANVLYISRFLSTAYYYNSNQLEVVIQSLIGRASGSYFPYFLILGLWLFLIS